MSMEGAPKNNWVDEAYKKAGIKVEEKKPVSPEDAFDQHDPALKKMEARTENKKEENN